MTSPSQEEASRRWTPEGTGTWYDRERWQNARRRERDPRIVRAILSRYASPGGLVLDAPCGTGRLAPAIGEQGRFVGLDASGSMLSAACSKGAGALLQGDLLHLPFQDASFDTVLCCRLLHHLKTQAELASTMKELLRVTRGVLAGSFWDSHSLAALRRRLPFVRQPAHRGPFPKRWIKAAVQAADGELIAWKHSARYFSQQTWFVARKR